MHKSFCSSPIDCNKFFKKICFQSSNNIFTNYSYINFTHTKHIIVVFTFWNHITFMCVLASSLEQLPFRCSPPGKSLVAFSRPTTNESRKIVKNETSETFRDSRESRNSEFRDLHSPVRVQLFRKFKQIRLWLRVFDTAFHCVRTPKPEQCKIIKYGNHVCGASWGL